MLECESESMENDDSWGNRGRKECSEGEDCLDLPNPALRDWPALRIQHTPHPIVGDKYKVWPLLDFQSAIEDHL